MKAFDKESALHYLALAEQASEERQGPQSAKWLEYLEAEHDNLITALQWFIESGEAERAQLFCCALLWNDRGRITEGRVWLAKALALPSPPTMARASALYRAGELAWRQDDMASSKLLNEEMLSIARQLGDKRNMISALGGLVRVGVRDNDSSSALVYAEEGVKIAEELGDERAMVSPLFLFAYATRNVGDYVRASELLGQSLALNQKFGLQRMIALVYHHKGHIALHMHDLQQATALFAESLRMSRTISHKDVMSNNLMCCAAVAAAEGNLERAARLLGAGQAQFERLGVIPDPADRIAYDHSLATTRSGLDERTFTTNYTAGRAMPFEQAIDYALQVQ